MRNRIKSVDSFRVLAIMAVIAIHTTPFREIENIKLAHYASIIINQIARFAVPFFFVISGYFYGKKVTLLNDPKEYTVARIKRILLLWIFWSVIYIMPYNLWDNIHGFISYGILGPLKISYWHFCNLLSNPMKLLFEGTKVHLWFLNALIWSIIICYLARNRYILLIIFAIGLYLFGLLAKSYSCTPIGIKILFNTRNGPFFGTLLFISGYILSKNNPNTSWCYKGLIISLFGIIIHFTEIFLLWKEYNVSPYHDYVIGTFFMGLGVAIMALSTHPILNLSDRLSKIGQLTLGIYCIHFVFIDNFRPIEQKLIHPFGDIIYPLFVFLSSYYSILVLSRNRYLRNLLK